MMERLKAKGIQTLQELSDEWYDDLEPGFDDDEDDDSYPGYDDIAAG